MYFLTHKTMQFRTKGSIFSGYMKKAKHCKSRNFTYNEPLLMPYFVVASSNSQIHSLRVSLNLRHLLTSVLIFCSGREHLNHKQEVETIWITISTLSYKDYIPDLHSCSYIHVLYRWGGQRYPLRLLTSCCLLDT